MIGPATDGRGICSNSLGRLFGRTLWKKVCGRDYPGHQTLGTSLRKIYVSFTGVGINRNKKVTKSQEEKVRGRGKQVGSALFYGTSERKRAGGMET